MSAMTDRTASQATLGPAQGAVDERPAGRRRRIGALGTAARAVLGLALLADVLTGHWSGPFRPAAWALGLVGLPAVAVGWQRLRARRNPTPLRATGPLRDAFTLCVVLLVFISDAVLIFVGISMVAAALRGQAGCEVLAIPNWLLGRDDELGCAVLWPVDQIDRLVGRRGR